MGADASGALAHRDEAEAGRADLVQHEAASVVHEDEPSGRTARQREGDVPGLRVAGDVGQGLLGDSRQRVGDGIGQADRGRRVERHGDAGAPLEGGGVVAQRVPEVGLALVHRAQLDQQRAHFGQRAARQLADLREVAARRVLVGLPERGHDLRQQVHAHQRLRHGVVQLARQTATLLEHGELLAALGDLEVLLAAVDRGGQQRGGDLVGLQLGGLPLVDLGRAQVHASDTPPPHDERDDREGGPADAGLKLARRLGQPRVGAIVAHGDHLPSVQLRVQLGNHVGQPVLAEHHALAGDPAPMDDGAGAPPLRVKLVHTHRALVPPAGGDLLQVGGDYLLNGHGHGHPLARLVQELGGGEGVLQAAEQARVLDGDGRVAREQGQRLDVLVVEVVRQRGAHAEHADDALRPPDGNAERRVVDDLLHHRLVQIAIALDVEGTPRLQHGAAEPDAGRVEPALLARRHVNPGYGVDDRPPEVLLHQPDGPRLRADQLNGDLDDAGEQRLERQVAAHELDHAAQAGNAAARLVALAAQRRQLVGEGISPALPGTTARDDHAAIIPPAAASARPGAYGPARTRDTRRPRQSHSPRCEGNSPRGVLQVRAAGSPMSPRARRRVHRSGTKELP